MTEGAANWKFRMEFGPAFLAVIGQSIGGVIAVTMIYASLSNTAANTKATADKLETIVEKQSDRQSQLSEKIVRVESNVGAITSNVNDLKSSLVQINSKLDHLKN